MTRFERRRREDRARVARDKISRLPRSSGRSPLVTVYSARIYAVGHNLCYRRHSPCKNTHHIPHFCIVDTKERFWSRRVISTLHIFHVLCVTSAVQAVLGVNHEGGQKSRTSNYIVDTTLCFNKKPPPEIFFKTSANKDRFTQFFHCHIPKEIVYVAMTSPQLCCCTALWNLNN